jgi:hypothetical protein
MRHRGAGFVPAAFVLILLTAQSAWALPALVNGWRPWELHAEEFVLKDLGTTRAEYRQMEPGLLRINDLIHACPSVSPPKGFEPEVRSVLSGGTEESRLPLPVYLTFAAWPPRAGETANALQVHINDLGATPNSLPFGSSVKGARLEDREGEFFLAPVPTGSYQGLPVYAPNGVGGGANQQADSGVIVIARALRPLWVPVPLERALAAILKKAQEDADSAERERVKHGKELEEWISPAAQQKRQERIAAAQAKHDDHEVRHLQSNFGSDEGNLRLRANPQRGVKESEETYFHYLDALQKLRVFRDSLSAEQRRGPGCAVVRAGAWDWDVRVGEAPGCQTFVVPNRGYFDPKLPRTAIQLVVVEGVQLCERYFRDYAYVRDNPWECNAVLRVARELDWKKLAALVLPADAPLLAPAEAAPAAAPAAKPTGMQEYEDSVRQGDSLLAVGNYFEAVRMYEHARRVAYNNKLAVDAAALEAKLTRAKNARDAKR